MHKKILIIGDAGRGKSTFANALSKKLNIPHYSTDDFFYIKKFSIPNDKQKSVEQIAKIYEKDEWIVEGTTRRLIKEGIEKADVIYYLKFKWILPQYYYIIKRNLGRSYESLRDLWKLLKHATLKRYSKNYGNYSQESVETMIQKYENKIVRLYTHKEIHKILDK